MDKGGEEEAVVTMGEVACGEFPGGSAVVCLSRGATPVFGSDEDNAVKLWA